MVNLEYVKKRKRKKAAGIIAAIGSIGVSVLVLVSFLGRFTGTFTVSLNSGEVKLSLSRDSEFTSPTSFIKLETLPAFGEMTFTSLPSFSELDSENTQYTDYAHYSQDGTKIDDIPFFKYTFYVKNNGDVTARYNFSFNITTNNPAVDGTGRTIDQFLRVMIFENDVNQLDSHNYTVYAKRSDSVNYDENHNETHKEFISYSLDTCERNNIQFPGFAEEFKNASTVATLNNVNFEKDEVMRYTIVLWCEGEDPQLQGEAPEGAKLKLGVTINAYEN